MEREQREAKRIIGNGVARAYGFRRTDDFVDDCPRCHGDGTVQWAPPYHGSLGYDPQQVEDVTCPVCHGTGEAPA